MKSRAPRVLLFILAGAEQSPEEGLCATRQAEESRAAGSPIASRKRRPAEGAVQTAFLEAWFRGYGPEFIAHYPDYYLPYGVSLSEDGIGCVSTDWARGGLSCTHQPADTTQQTARGRGF